MNTTTVCNAYHAIDGAKHCLSSPFYYSFEPSLIAGIRDNHLALAAPIIAYWSLSLFFHFLDISGWKWLEKYRIHESKEVTARNRATRTEVVLAVILQHIIQTALGFLWLSPGKPVNHVEKMQRITAVLRQFTSWAVDQENLEVVESPIVYYVYWWAIPAFQLISAMCVFCYL